MHPFFFILIFIAITGIGIFLATRERDDLIDQDEKVPQGKAQKIETGPKTYDVSSATPGKKELKTILKHKHVDYKIKKKSEYK